MKHVSVAQDIVPIGEFKAHASKWFERASRSGQPLVITHNGQAAGVMLSPKEFDRLQYRMHFLDSVARGLSDAQSGHTLETRKLKERLNATRLKRSL